MRKIFLALTFVSFLFSATNFNSMSNEELIALIGYVKIEEKKEFEKVLNERKDSFSKKEKEQYEKNIKRAK
ncbi:MAG: DUF1104 domain-containing protein [Sulfurospirillaceae bacterium]|jgi:hypothetical protein|nr:DUF1104 domain-containing protein [Sulfurospirillaceae bacterium]MCK9545130.1 DUF1104 domain-containing protein [Sulfurospirillaceae bacterium]MDY0237845.1 DUF1104 domain-containing protein [Campylobacterales bacterium]NLM99194.1 hypothetical protein [Campylobacteraceae bacterium]